MRACPAFQTKIQQIGSARAGLHLSQPGFGRSDIVEGGYYRVADDELQGEVGREPAVEIGRVSPGEVLQAGGHHGRELLGAAPLGGFTPHAGHERIVVQHLMTALQRHQP